jgi:phage portal protein BeeE
MFSAVAHLIVQGREGQPQWTKARYDKMAKEGFQNCVIGYKCVSKVAQAVSSVPWILKRKLSDGTLDPVYEHPALKPLRRPNALQGWSAYVYGLVAQLQLAGNAYVEAVGPETGDNPVLTGPISCI